MLPTPLLVSTLLCCCCVDEVVRRLSKVSLILLRFMTMSLDYVHVGSSMSIVLVLSSFIVLSDELDSIGSLSGWKFY